MPARQARVLTDAVTRRALRAVRDRPDALRDRVMVLPNLQGRASVSSGRDPTGATYSLGQVGGEEQHVLSLAETPPHTHAVRASDSTSGPPSTPSSSTVMGVGTSAAGQDIDVYGAGAAGGALAPRTIGGHGSGQGHENMMPYVAVSKCIATQGVFPTRP